MGLVLRTFKVDEEAWGAFMARCRREGITASAALRAFVGDESVVRGGGGAAKAFVAPVGVPERPFKPLSKAEQVGKGRK